MTSLICGNRKRLAGLENELMVARVRMGEGIVREFGVDMHTLLDLKWITNKDLLYSTRNSSQYSVITYMGKGSGKEWTYVSV